MTDPTTLVGRHHGRVMTVDEIGHHVKRWQRLEPDLERYVAGNLKPGDLILDLWNEIDRLRFLLAERNEGR